MNRGDLSAGNADVADAVAVADEHAPPFVGEKDEFRSRCCGNSAAAAAVGKPPMRV